MSNELPKKMNRDPRVAETLEQTLARLEKVKPQPSPGAESGLSRESTIRDLKAGWGAPRLHVDQTARREGPWERTLEKLLERLGTGFLVGLIGGYGAGKTQLAVEVMRVCVESKLRRAIYVTAVGFFIAIKSTYRKNSDDTEEDVLKRLTSPALLVIDEIGKRSDSQWENLLLFELLDRRYRDRKDTLVLSNQTLVEFTEGMGSALCSRMNEKGGLVECDWPSFRI